MSWWDYAKRVGIGIGTGGLSEVYNQVSDPNSWFNKRPMAPQIGENPYLGGMNDLIGQLQQQADGRGPSLAQGAYRQAHDQGLRDVLTMSRGGSAGAMRAGQQQIGQMTQGFQSGYSNARLQEQLAARQQLQGAMTNAGNMWFQPQQANLNSLLGTPSNGQMLTNLIAQLAAGAGTLSGKKTA